MWRPFTCAPALLAVVALLGLATAACAAPRHRHHRSVCVPVFVEGAGTILFCAPPRAR